MKIKDALYSSEPIYINLLQEKLEIQELQLNLDGAHEGDCNKPGETQKHLRQIRETHAVLFLTERVVGKLLCIQPFIRA